MQQHWLDFIYDEEPVLAEEEKFLVYGKDLSASYLDRKTDEEIGARLWRFRFIDAHYDVISRATRLVTGVDVV